MPIGWKAFSMHCDPVVLPITIWTLTSSPNQENYNTQNYYTIIILYNIIIIIHNLFKFFYLFSKIQRNASCVTDTSDFIANPSL